ncbi:hypothetical protein APR04_003852 [Promicromonospora umidemergens]|uniref:Immunity protein 63 of polymorphic toxin system n=2 Tax=Promicromonospora TaxID=43676 RepID=A0ABP8XHK2_9MICO|nr:hypothetical protein [Promicromonospora umidemergens]
MTQEIPDTERLVLSMYVLTDGLARIARTYEQHVYLNDEGDPERFSPGHFILYSEGQDQALFAIEEQYTGIDWPYPEDRLPTSWTWHTRRVVHQDGAYKLVVEEEGQVASPDVVELLVRAQTWARRESNALAHQEAPHRMPHRSHRPLGPKL